MAGSVERERQHSARQLSRPQTHHQVSREPRTYFWDMSFRWNSQTMDELQRMREREREMNLMRNMQQSQPMDGGVYINP